MLCNIFGIDPGTTTGWCYVREAESRCGPACDCDLDIACSEMSGEEFQQAFDLSRLIDRAWPCAVVIEDFIPRQINKERHFLSPVRVTYELCMLLWLKDRQWNLQSASLAKQTIKDEHLKGSGLWNVGQPHANDATRHALTLLRRIGGSGRTQGVGLYTSLIEPRGLKTMTPTDRTFD